MVGTAQLTALILILLASEIFFGHRSSAQGSCGTVSRRRTHATKVNSLCAGRARPGVDGAASIRQQRSRLYAVAHSSFSLPSMRSRCWISSIPLIWPMTSSARARRVGVMLSEPTRL